MKQLSFLLFVFFLPFHIFSQSINLDETKAYNGYFNFYYNEDTDKIYLEVKTLNEPFLYVNSLATGVGSNDIGLDRGQLGDERVVEFKKAGNKLLLIQPNLKFRGITDNELEKKSIEEAFAKSVLYGFKIVKTTNKSYIIDITSFLLQDAHGVANRLKSQGNYKLDVSKSALALERTKAFPNNIEFEAMLTFKGDAKGKYIKSVAPTASLVSVIQHHSFIKLPDNDYKKREFDVRSGAISISYLDYATPVQEPINKRYIIRHRLEKKKPNSAISEAKEPIIYYLDSGTPEPIKSALLEGASWWNEAFEAIGFKNAFQVKMLPEGADPMDCRYNVIQWVHRATRGWSYGASVVDPRTGEIIKGHVSLGSLRIRQDFLIAQALSNKPFAERDDNYEAMLNMALARIRQLSAHEVGHTLGFAHNFAASNNNKASVMDYPHPSFTLKNGNIDFSNAYAKGIGEWDKVTTAYSYSEFSNKTNEKEALNTILTQATNKNLQFISDYDARAKGGAHAFAHLWDNGKTIVDELNNILNIRETAIKNFSKDNIRANEPYSVLEDVFVPLYFLHRYQTEATTKIIGGLNYNYATKNDNQLIVETIDYSKQKEALNVLLKTIDAEVLAIPKDKLGLFPPRAFRYNRTRESFKSRTGVAFDPLSASATASEFTLGFLLHPERVNRLIQQKSLNSSQLGLQEVLNAITENTFNKNHNSSYLTEVQQMINLNYLEQLFNLANNEACFFQVKAIVNNTLDELYQELGSDIYAKEYKRLIEQFKKNPELFKENKAPKIPDGSPIGTDVCNYQEY